MPLFEALLHFQVNLKRCEQRFSLMLALKDALTDQQQLKIATQIADWSGPPHRPHLANVLFVKCWLGHCETLLPLLAFKVISQLDQKCPSTTAYSVCDAVCCWELYEFNDRLHI